MEEHFTEVAIGEAVRGLGRDQAALDSALLHAIVIDAAAVVFYFDVNVIAAMIGAEGNFAGFGLSGGAAFGAMLDAVSDGIAHEVHEWVGNLLNNVVVQLGFAAGELELNLLAGGCGCVAHRTG